MSLVQELIAAVTNSERQIDEQITKLTNYSNEISQVTQKVQSAFEGSQQEYGQKMLQQLAQTKDEVNKTIGHLQSAKTKLMQVRMI